jgi:hypothetical protein
VSEGRPIIWLCVATGFVILLGWFVCVIANVHSHGEYRIPTEVTAALMGMVTCLFSVPVISYLTRKDDP